MKNIQILRLTLENFKCHKHLDLMLGGRNVSIYGDNASGKTSVYDALTWLLFGKDSAGNGEKNIDIKPLDSSGAVADRNAITSVEAVFSVDGEEISLKRSYREVWSTKRGSSTETYDGNTSDYAVDGVPCKKNVYDAKIGELVSEDVFRLLTSVSYFSAVLPWQRRRELLFDIAGTLTDQEIMQQDTKFAPLLFGMGKLTLDDYRKKLVSEKKGYTGIKSETPARISECQKTLDDLAGIDFDDLRNKEAEAVQKVEGLTAVLQKLGSDQVTEKLSMDLREATFRLDQLEAKNRAFRDSQTAGMENPEAIRRDLTVEQGRLGRAETMLEAANAGAERCAGNIKTLRDQWAEINGRIFTGEHCPTCGQELPEAQLAAARERFEADRTAILRRVEAEAARMKNEQAQMVQRAADITQEIEGRKETIARLQNKLHSLADQMVAPSDMEEYAEVKAALTKEISEIRRQLEEAQTGFSERKADLTARLSAARDRLRDLQGQRATESVVAYTHKRMEDLRKDAQNAARALETIEQTLFLMDEFTRYKTRFVENGINSRFMLAKIRLFREQANGGVEDRCDVTYNGVPYMGLNNGAKINVGIDIIRTLSQHYGVSVPLFVDNAESVTRLEACGMQTIRLVVSEHDKELRLDYEN